MGKQLTKAMSFPWTAGALVAAIGSSTMARAEIQGVSTFKARTSWSPLTWMQTLSKGALVCPQSYNLGISSSLIAAQIAQLPALAALYPRPRFCAFYGFSNDWSGDRPLADIFADVQTLIDGILALGITPIIFLNHVQNNQTLARTQKWGAGWQWMLDLAAKDKRVIVVSALDTLLDPTSTDFAARQKPGYVLSDLVHLTVRGAFQNGLAAWNTVKPLLPIVPRKLLANWDTYATNNPSGNLLTNGLMVGTGGSILTGVIGGDIAASWTAANNTVGATVTGVVLADGGQQFTIGGTAGAGTNRGVLLYQDVDVTGKFSAGDKVYAEIDVEEDASTGMYPTYLMLRVTYGATVYEYVCGATYQEEQHPALTDAWVGKLRTPTIELTGVPTAMRIRVVKDLVDGLNSPSGVIRLKGAQVRKTSPALS